MPEKINLKLLELLVCPVTHGRLAFDRERDELISVSAKLAYPIKGGVPMMLEDEARQLSDEEAESYRHRYKP